MGPEVRIESILLLNHAYRFDRIFRLFAMMDKCMHTSFTQYRFEENISWIHNDWNVTLLGDACHAMVVRSLSLTYLSDVS